MLKIKITNNGNLSLQHKYAPVGESNGVLTYHITDVPRNTDTGHVAHLARQSSILRREPWTIRFDEIGEGKIVR